MTLLLVCLFTQLPPITLEVNEELKVYTSLKMEIAKDGTILIATPFRLFHWSEEGELIRSLPPADFPPVQFLSTYLYDPQSHIYWLVDSRHKQSLFFDTEGGFLGRAQGPYRDLMAVGSRVFAVLGHKLDLWEEHLMLQRVGYRIHQDGVEVFHIGEAFAPLTAHQESYLFQFKRHWLIQEDYSKRFLVVDQITPYMRVFQLPEREGEGSGLRDTNQRIYLDLPQRKQPDLQSDKRQTGSEKWAKLDTIVGFYPLKNHYLVAYTLPFNAGEEERVALQQVGRDGRIIGQRIEAQGQLVGVHENLAYLYRNGRGGLPARIDRIPLTNR